MNVDDGEILPGEAPDGFRSTAEHWLSVYDELLRFAATALTATLTDQQRQVLENRERALRRRRDFWARELCQGGDGVQPPTDDDAA